MSRRRTPKKRIVMPDPVYDSRLIELVSSTNYARR